MNKHTEELMNELKAVEHVKTFLTDNCDEIVCQDLQAYLARLLMEKRLKKAEIIRSAEIDTVYGYQIFQGIKQPSRNKLLCLAVGMRLTINETQQLLRAAQLGALYPRIKRDAIIIFGLERSLSVNEINDVLFELGEYTLG